MRTITTIATVTIGSLAFLGCIIRLREPAGQAPARAPRTASVTASPVTPEIAPPLVDVEPPSIALPVSGKDLRPHVKRLLADPSAVQATPLNEVATTLADHLLRMETVVVNESLSALVGDVPGLRDAVVAELARRSRDGDTVSRCRALAWLAGMGDASALDSLLRGLSADPDPGVRRALARHLPQSLTADPSVRELMVGVIIADADEEVRLMVTQSLPRELSDSEVRALLPRLTADRSIENREALLRVIARAAGDREVVQAEFRRISSDAMQPEALRTLAHVETLHAIGSWEGAASPADGPR